MRVGEGGRGRGGREGRAVGSGRRGARRVGGRGLGRGERGHARDGGGGIRGRVGADVGDLGARRPGDVVRALGAHHGRRVGEGRCRVLREVADGQHARGAEPRDLGRGLGSRDDERRAQRDGGVGGELLRGGVARGRQHR
ncbi:hypothetical protein [Clavibacter zhangzhiyongii]|uniref:hypothetical protein n=1 Tax=Clavibacter zhangzhiyongii TaxID=2768071 RepID=UPI0039E12136